MLTAMVIVFLVGYLMIALEHPLKINKAGTALLIGTILWVMYTYAAPFFIPRASAEEFSLFLESFPSLGSLTFKEQCTRFVVEHQVLDSIGEIAETLIFLIGAMITVELIDAHGGFMFITNHITTKKKKKLLALIAVITFFMSAVLDNLTTSIVMIMLIRKLLGNYKERWVFGSIIIIAANSGGAWRRDYDHALGKGKYLHVIHDSPFDPAEYRIGVDPGLDRHAFLAWQRDAP